MFGNTVSSLSGAVLGLEITMQLGKRRQNRRTQTGLLQCCLIVGEVIRANCECLYVQYNTATEQKEQNSDSNASLATWHNGCESR